VILREILRIALKGRRPEAKTGVEFCAWEPGDGSSEAIFMPEHSMTFTDCQSVT
jgi:hypothetical protein